jgi:hypothetical protein
MLLLWAVISAALLAVALILNTGGHAAVAGIELEGCCLTPAGSPSTITPRRHGRYSCLQSPVSDQGQRG